MTASNLIFACHLTGIYDVNRSTVLQDDDFSIVQEWAASVAAAGLHGIIFHNNFSEHTCRKQENKSLSFVRVEHDTRFSPNVFRYIAYRDFLRAHASGTDHLFVTDIADVVVLQNPFIQDFYLQNPMAIFCGDEPKMLGNEWMDAHSEHLRNNIADYAAYELEFREATLLNCGVIGGNIAVMCPFLEQLAAIHTLYNAENKTAYTGDMGAFNYLLRTRMNEKIIHGAPVNTIFKAYEKERADCWFRHK